MAYAEQAETEALHEPKSFLTKYIWSQDHKVIAIQYSLTALFVGLVALVLSGLMRIQIGFPGSLAFMDASTYYQAMTMHGMARVGHLQEWPVTERLPRSLGVMDTNVRMIRRWGR